MFSEFLYVVIPIIGLIINIFIQVWGIRYRSNLTLLKSVIVGFFAGFVSVIILKFSIFSSIPVSGKEFLFRTIANLIIYSALGYCYFHFINLGETARRIRILREVYEAPEGLSQEEILERYNAKHIVDMRLRRLLVNGQIVERQGRYCIGNPVMLFIAKSIIALKFIILGKKSEFD